MGPSVIIEGQDDSGCLHDTQGRRNIRQTNSFQMSHGRMHCPLGHYTRTSPPAEPLG